MFKIELFPNAQLIISIFGLLAVSMFVAAIAAIFPKKK